MKQIFSICVFLMSLFAVHNAFGQYDYDDGDLKPRKQKDPNKAVTGLSKQ